MESGPTVVLLGNERIWGIQQRKTFGAQSREVIAPETDHVAGALELFGMEPDTEVIGGKVRDRRMTTLTPMV